MLSLDMNYEIVQTISFLTNTGIKCYEPFLLSPNT